MYKIIGQHSIFLNVIGEEGKGQGVKIYGTSRILKPQRLRRSWYARGTRTASTVSLCYNMSIKAITLSQPGLIVSIPYNGSTCSSDKAHAVERSDRGAQTAI